MSVHDGYKIIRERVFIEHTSPEIRKKIDELTVLNQSKISLRSIIVYRPGFMTGLKITDEEGRELPFLSNDYTKRYLDVLIVREPANTEFKELRKRIDKREIFAVWIKLPESHEIKHNETKIIKFEYYDTTLPYKMTLGESLYHQKFLFTVTRNRTQITRAKGDAYDIFVIISYPEGYDIEYKIETNAEMVNGIATPFPKEKVHINENTNTLQIRVPSSKNETRFDMFYDIVPEKNDRLFYSLAVFALIGLSISFGIIGSKILFSQEAINSNVPLSNWLYDVGLSSIFEKYFSQPIHSQVKALFGGIITVSLAAVGLMRNSSTNRTRFWFLFPIIISAIMFLFVAP